MIVQKYGCVYAINIVVCDWLDFKTPHIIMLDGLCLFYYSAYF